MDFDFGSSGPLYYEPGADFREVAIQVRKIHNSFTEVGFDEEQAYGLLITFLEANT